MDFRSFIKVLKVLLFTLLFIPQLKAQVVATWNATGTIVGGFYNNLEEKNWYNPANWTWTVGGAPTNPTHASVPANGIPDATTDVVIPSGTAVCWIPPNNEDYCIDATTTPTAPTMSVKVGTCTAPASEAPIPQALSITINGGALFNQAGSGVGAPASLLVSNTANTTGNVTVTNGGGVDGILMIETPKTKINGNLNIEANGHFVIKSGEIEVELRQDFKLDGSITKLQTNSNGIFTMNFSGDSDSQITGTNKTNQISADLGSLAPYITSSRFTTGAFDNITINKEVSQGQDYFVTNTDGGMPFISGVVDASGALLLSSTGNFTINKGTVIINDAIKTFQTFNASDGWSWRINDPDINIRGKLFIANADVGTVSYKGASLDLWQNSAGAGNEEDITMHIGGSIEDLNVFYPSESNAGGQSRAGLYVGTITPTTTASVTRPIIVFNGSSDQDIRGLGGSGTSDQLQNFAANPSEGVGIVLPNVIYNPMGTTQRLTINASSNLRIVGHLLVIKGTFSLNSRKLLFGDRVSGNIGALQNVTTYTYGDEINVYGTFELTPASTLKMATGNTLRGTFLRIRNGGKIESLGTANQNVSITRDGVPGNYYRIAAYSGAIVRITYTLFELISPDNSGYNIVTNVGTDNSTGGTHSKGGFKCYPGSALATDIDHDGEASTPNVTSFSYCGMSFGGPNVTFLTFNTGQTVQIDNMLLGDTGNNLVCTSNACTPQFRNVVSNNGGLFTMFKSSGSSGGSRVGEFNDGGNDDASIVWTGPTPIYWLGPQGVSMQSAYTSGNKNNTGVYRKWSDSDANGFADNRGWSLSPSAYIPIDADPSKIPGTAGFTNFDVYVPSTCNRNLLIDADYTLDGGYFFLDYFASPQFTDGGGIFHSRQIRRATFLNDGVTLTLGGDFSNTGLNNYSWVGGVFYAGTNSILNVAGSFFTASGRGVEGEIASSLFEAFTGSTVVLNGTGNQELRLRTNALNNLTINKASGTVLTQGLAGATYYSQIIKNKFLMLNGGFIIRSTCPLVIQGDYEQQGGTVDFDLSPITVQGDFKVTAGTLTPNSSTVYFTPNTTADRIIQIDGSNAKLNNVVFNRSNYIPTAGHNSPGNHLTDPAFQATIPATTVTSGLVRYNITSSSNTFETLNSVVIENNREVTMAEDLVATTGDITVNNGGELSTSAGTEILIRASQELKIDNGGVFNAVGSVSKFTKISRKGTGNDAYKFSVDGVLKARYYLIEFTDVNGVNLGSTASTLSPGVTIVGGGGENYDVTTTATIVGGGGIGATATTNITASITQVNVANQGGGYTSVPTVTITPGPATADAVINGPVTGIYITNGGEYSALPTGVTFTPIGTGTGASGIVRAGVKNISLTNAGAKYANAPTITFTGGGGGGAAASATLSAEVVSYTVDNGGEGYVTIPAPTLDHTGTNNTGNATAGTVSCTVSGVKDLTPGSGYISGTTGVTIDGGTFTRQATATPVISTTGQILSINLTSAGAGYLNTGGGDGNFSVVFTGGGPTTPATALATVVGGVITRIDITDAGTGYTSAPTIDLETNGDRSGGSAAAATAVYAPSGGIIGITITDPGAGYTAPPTGFTITGGAGSGANFTLTLSIESLALGVGGSGYEAAPNVTFPAPPAASDITPRTASATANLSGIVKSITLDNAGNGYTTMPALTIQSPGATATAVLTGDKVTSVNITNGGANYTTVPTVTFSAGTATAVAIVEDGIVTGISITNQGSGYATAPTVTIGLPTGGVQATASFTMAVNEISLSSGGLSYDLPPTIAITGGTAITAATAQATMSVQSIKLTNTGSGYAALPTITIESPNTAGIGIANGAIQAIATAETVGEISSITVATGGSDYTGTPFVIITDPSGNGRGAAAKALLTSTTVSHVTVIDGGHYTVDPTLTITGGGGAGATATVTMVSPGFSEISKAKINNKGTCTTDGSYDVVVEEGLNTTATVLVTVVDKVVAAVRPKVQGTGYTTDIDISGAVNTTCGCTGTDVVALKGSRISTINVTANGAGYTGTPTLTITPQAGDTEAGEGAAIVYLNKTTVASVMLTTKNVYPAATFSDGIFTNGFNRDNAGGTVNGTFITFPENYSVYRNNINAYSTIESLPSSVTHNYTATPAVDTIRGVIFPQNPTRLSNPFNTNNVRRNGTGTNAINNIVFKDALGTFSGEDYDDEQNNNNVIIWVEPNIVRWDGGPTNSGTAWSNPNNWRPNGVPTPDKNVIIDYTYAALQSNNLAGPSTVIAPSPQLIVDFDLDPTAFPITCRSLTIETLIPGLNPTNARSPVVLNVTRPMSILESFSASAQTTIDVKLSSATISIGGSWSNEGTFVHGGGTVEFNQPLTRTINAASGIVESYTQPITHTGTATVGEGDVHANAFFNLILSDGTTELNSYLRVEHDLTIKNASTRFNPSNSNFTIELWGKWQNEGTFDPKSGKVIFANNLPQTVGKGFRTAAEADAVVAGGVITAINLKAGLEGEKYAIEPKVVIEGNGRGATATTTIDGNGTITSVNVTNGGTGYTGVINVNFVSVDREVMHNVDVFKSGDHVTLLTRTEIANSLDFRANNIISDTLRECIVGGNVTTNGGAGYVDGPMGRIYNSTAPEPKTYSIGKGTNFPGEVSLNLTLNGTPASGDAGKALYLIERFNTLPVNGRTIPAAADVNVLLDAHYRVYQAPYPLINSNYPTNNVAGELNFATGKIGIPLDLTVESLTTKALFGATVNLSTIAVAQLDNYRILADPGDATPVNAQAPLKGLDVEVPYHSPGVAWNNLGGENNVNANIGGTTVISSVASFTQLGSGTFAMGIKYAALPVDLLSLDATPQGGRVFVKWTSFAEKDLSHYEVERSLDGENFVKISDQLALGNSGLSQSYNAIDNSPSNGINYYRLKVWDSNGTFRHSKIVSAVITPNAGFQIFPNPNNGSFVKITSEETLPDEDIVITITDVSGKVVYTKVVNASSRTSSNIIELQSLNLSSGLHFIDMKGKTLSSKLKLVISK